MYNHLHGIIAVASPLRVVLDIGGVGWELTVPLSTSQELPACGAEATLLTHLVVKEADLSLYGFLSADERDCFRKLIGISGVGPALAIKILSATSPQDFALAIERQDTSFLTRIKGIGGKKANQILLALKGAKMVLTAEVKSGVGTGITADAVVALQTLGMSEREAVERVNQVLSNAPDLPLEELVQSALQ